MKLRNIAADEVLPLLLCAASTLGILPFAIMRLVQGDWIMAIIDSLIVLSMALLGIFVFRTHKVRLASIYIAVLCVVGALVTVYIKGPMQVFWTYPATMVAFYILKPREGVLLVCFTAIALVPVLATEMSIAMLASVVVTLLITNAVAYSFAIQTALQQEQLLKLANRDPLTGAGNRRALEVELDRVVALRNRTGVPASVLMLDLDRFKRINDEHGHAIGDKALVCVSQIITSRIRKIDSFFRIGGEEFVVVVENDHLKSAITVAEDLRTDIEHYREIKGVRLTISIGIAELVDGENTKNWLARADEALYEAKRSGRNRTALAPFPQDIAKEPVVTTSHTIN